jgi:hypothetical protein
VDGSFLRSPLRRFRRNFGYSRGVFFNPRKTSPWVFGSVGLLVVLVGVPVSNWWKRTHPDHALERLQREAEPPQVRDVDATVVDPCTSRWSAGDAGDAGASAREIAAAILGRKNAVRVRFPIAAFGVRGLAKLRYTEEVEARLEPDEALPDEAPVPCIDPDAGGGVREGTCRLPWSAASDVAECAER